MVYAPIANCAGVCVVETVVDEHVPNFRSTPTVDATQLPNPRIVEEPAVHAAKTIALVFDTEPLVPDPAAMSVPATLLRA